MTYITWVKNPINSNVIMSTVHGLSEAFNGKI